MIEELATMCSKMPEIVMRKHLAKYDFPFSYKTLANADCNKENTGKIMVGRNVGYKKRVLFEWLNSRVKG